MNGSLEQELKLYKNTSVKLLEKSGKNWLKSAMRSLVTLSAVAKQSMHDLGIALLNQFFSFWSVSSFRTVSSTEMNDFSLMMMGIGLRYSFSKQIGRFT